MRGQRRAQRIPALSQEETPMATRKLSVSVRNMNRRNRRVSEPDIPRPLLGRDLAGFRLEYWYVLIDGDRSQTYFRSRRFAVQEWTRRELTRKVDAIAMKRVRVLTDNGRRGWPIDGGAPAYVRIRRTWAAEREAHTARRVRKAQAAASAAA